MAFLLLVVAIVFGAKPSVAGTSLIDNDSTFRFTYVRFNFGVVPDTEYIVATTTLRCVARTLRTDNRIELRLRNRLLVDSIRVDNVASTFEHSDDTLYVTLPKHYGEGSTFDVAVSYHGFNYSGPFIHTTQVWDSVWRVMHPGQNIPILWTSSEPFGSKEWWPCKDNPSEKIDSADFVISCPKNYQIAANGTWTKTVEGDTGRTYYWHEAYPISHYLLAFICSRFDTVHYWHHWADGDSTQILDFIFPYSADTERQYLGEVDSILDQYEKWFGPYPFRKEKYGIAQWHGGGMENQTLSFCNDANESLVAHETAHQWFGDAITCKIWNDCWLNEGFATYVTALYEGHKHGASYFDTSMKYDELNVTFHGGSSVHVPDSLLEQQTLNGARVYSKGGFVLHMLRFLLGSDSTFLRAIREYMTGPLRYGVATTEDLRVSVEQSTGLDLKWFFDQWVYAEGYPIYSLAWDGYSTATPAVAISQRGSNASSPFFRMPVELEFIGTGIDTTVRVWNTRELQAYSFQFSAPVDRVIFDPHNWLLDGELPRTLDVREAPNTNEDVTVISTQSGYRFDLNTIEEGLTRADIFDLLGKRISTLGQQMHFEGEHSIVWNTSDISAGLYLCRIVTGDVVRSVPVIVTSRN